MKIVVIVLNIISKEPDKRWIVFRKKDENSTDDMTFFLSEMILDLKSQVHEKELSNV